MISAQGGRSSHILAPLLGRQTGEAASWVMFASQLTSSSGVQPRPCTPLHGILAMDSLKMYAPQAATSADGIRPRRFVPMARSPESQETPLHC
mmetsp:Transcript_1993/g.5938  ORF Transcript_1993/g.5938 Transcript_1993/m.5938 type:complete len:93 (+) Transcript_1993:3652-3930(+)